MIRIHIFHTGKVIVDRSIPYHESNPLAVTGFLRGKDKKLTLPVSCYLIEHPKGKVLIDTGWDTKYAHERPNRMLDDISRPVICENGGVDSKLKAMQILPEDIDGVYFSHMDFDHTSGIPLVNGAKRFFAAREELSDANRYFFRYVKSCWRGVNVESFDYGNSGVGPVGSSYDVFGDGSVLLVNTPGHSHGHFSVKVTSADGKYVILAGDGVYTQKSIRERIIPGFTVDTALAKKSVDWICECAADENCLLVAPNHDPDIPEQTIEL
ncbi:MAG: N-acyl homoserine lactonase family protein [Oscillospiraceae bacterium]|nr:N-acyl homoserine lactonase family protein [Oscillospiraceae bacterium]